MATPRPRYAAEAGVAAGEVTSKPAAGDGLSHHSEDHECRTDEPVAGNPATATRSSAFPGHAGRVAARSLALDRSYAATGSTAAERTGHLGNNPGERDPVAVKYVKLGSTGLDVSAICLVHELRRADGRQAPVVARRGDEPPFFRQALEAGINFFDTANVLPRTDQREITEPRLADAGDEVVLATKVHGRMHEGPNGAGLSRKAILTQIDPACAGSAPTTSTSTRSTAGTITRQIEETMETLHDVVRQQGGASGHRRCGPGSSPRRSTSPSATAGPASCRCKPYNLLHREEEREMLPLCADQGVGVIPWSPWRAVA